MDKIPTSQDNGSTDPSATSKAAPASGNWKAVTGNKFSEPFPEPPENGINAWVFRAAVHCKKSGLSQEQAGEKIRSYEPKLRRYFSHDEVERALRKTYSSSTPQRARTERQPKLPDYDPSAVAAAVEASEIKTLADLNSRSGDIPEDSDPDYYIDRLFPGNPLLCAAKEGAWNFLTHYREEWKGELGDVTLIVPSPMTSPQGMKADGSGISAHTSDNTGPRRYLVVESDHGGSLDEQAAVIGHLMEYAPLVCVVFSGNKSLHAFFNVEGYPERDVIRFFHYAVKLGADPRMWTRSQFTRLPDGWNYDKSARQVVHYFMPDATMETLPPPPGVPPGYAWKLKNAADAWTDDPTLIDGMSAPPIIHGLLRDGDAATIVGGAKTQKSWLAVHMGICVASGISFLGNTVSKRRVLYLDYELKEGTFLKRLCMLADSPPVGLLYHALRGEERLPTMEDIEDIIVSENIGLVILDPLYRTGLLQEENSNDSTGRELIALQKIATRTGAALVVIDHTAKGGGSERSTVDAARGASAKGGFFDAIMVLRPKPSESQGISLITLDVVTRDWPRLAELPLASFTWGAGRCLIELLGTVSREDPSMVHDSIVEYLRSATTPVGMKDMASTLRIPETTLRNALRKLEESGRVKSIPDPDHRQRKLYLAADRKSEVESGMEVADETQA